MDESEQKAAKMQECIDKAIKAGVKAYPNLSESPLGAIATPEGREEYKKCATNNGLPPVKPKIQGLQRSPA